jgi:hypothetical protein
MKQAVPLSASSMNQDGLTGTPTNLTSLTNDETSCKQLRDQGIV